MKTVYAVLLLCVICSGPAWGRDEVSLNDAVNQAKADGQVLSAKTVNGRHEIKILTPSGKVKTINRKAAETNRQRQLRHVNESRSMEERIQNELIRDRFRDMNSQQRTTTNQSQRNSDVNRNSRSSNRSTRNSNIGNRSSSRGNERGNQRSGRSASRNKQSNSKKDK